MLFGGLAHFICNDWMAKLTPIVYGNARATMYLLYILRLHRVYKQSIFAFNKILLIISAILVIIMHLSVSIYGAISVTQDKHVWFGQIYTCHMRLTPLYTIMSLPMDIILTFIALYVFTTPLIKILRALNSKYPKNDHDYDKDFTGPVIKIWILTSVSGITTLIAHIISILTLTNVAYGFDTPINCICIVLMSEYYSKSYEMSCCLLIKCINCCDKRNKENIAIDIINDKNETNNNDEIEHESQFETRTNQLPSDSPSILIDDKLEFTKSVL